MTEKFDKMFPKPYFDSISLELHISGCPNTCRHCKDDGRKPFGELISLDDAKWIVGQFSDLTKSDPPIVRNIGTFIHHEPTAHRDFISLQEYCLEVSHNPEDLIGTFATNGYRIARDDDYLNTLNRLKEQGFNAIKSSLHGLEDYHDWFVCRKGAFRDIFLTAERAVEAGMVVGFNIYLDRNSTKDFIDLIDFIRKFGRDMKDRFGSGEIGIEVAIPSFVVGSRRLRVYESKLRPRLSDLDALRPELEQFIKPPYDRYTESYWAGKVQNQPQSISEKQLLDEVGGEDNGFYERNAILAVDRFFDVYERSYHYDWQPVKQGNLKIDGALAILEKVRAWTPPDYPDVGALAYRYGDKNSTLIHRKLSSARNKWLDASMMNTKNAHLCIAKSGLIKPNSIWQIRWITDEDHKAITEPFRKWQDRGWTLEEFQQLREGGYLYCGVFLGGRICSIAGLWKRADDIWEVIAVGTREEYMRQGMAKSCVHFIADYILQNCKSASYTARESNIASVRTAQSVGFRYCTNTVNNDKWCAQNPRPSVRDAICPLLNEDT